MAKLTAEQETLVSKLWDKNKQFLAEEAELQAIFDAKKEGLRVILRESVAECREAGIPERAICQRGMELKQVSVMRTRLGLNESFTRATILELCKTDTSTLTINAVSN